VRAGAAAVLGLSTGETRRRFRELLQEPFVTRYDNDDVRDYWQTRADLRLPKTTKGHSHAEAARHRTAAARLINNITDDLMRPHYVVSSCKREDPLDATYHGWFIDKDPVFKSRRDSIPKNAIVKMVDVDYYIDWNVWARKARPIILYTFVPDDVLYSNEEYSYGLTSTGVEMHVNGGATYIHQLWNYSFDHLAVKTSWGKTVVYSVSVKTVDRHHRMILLNPVYSVRFVGKYFNLTYMHRMQFSFGSTGVHHNYRTRDGEVTSLGLLSGGIAVTTVTLPGPTIEAIRIRLARS